MTANEVAAGIAIGVGISAVLWLSFSLIVWRVEDRRYARHGEVPVPGALNAERDASLKRERREATRHEVFRAMYRRRP